MQAVTLGFKDDGTTEMIFGAEVNPATQREAVMKMRDPADYPSQFVHVEMWTRNKRKSVGRAGVEAVAKKKAAKKAAKKKAPATAAD